ncbi:MAG TPA: hypothetical protein VJ798_12535 [Rhizomicrobium sp.]|nr:hypothetical protein [Rhizomicrobium sp.]
MAEPRFYSTLLKCIGCNALGAITWDLRYREAAEDRSFIALNGDFHLDAVRVAGHDMIVCSQCDSIYGPLPANSVPLPFRSTPAS